MTEQPEPQQDRSFLRLKVDKLLSPSFKKTFFKFAPSLKLGLGSLFTRTALTTAAVATIATGGVVGGLEVTNATDILDKDSGAINVTLIQDANGVSAIVPAAQAPTILEEILLEVRRLEVDPTVIVVIPAETQQAIARIDEALATMPQAVAAILLPQLQGLFPPGQANGLTPGQQAQLDAVEDGVRDLRGAIFR